MNTTLKKPQDVNTAAVVSVGLIGGWLTARETGIRPLGLVPLASALGWAGRSWLAKRDWKVCALLSALYIGAFGASHPLAKKIGAWPSVLTVTGSVAAAAYALSDSQ